MKKNPEGWNLRFLWYDPGTDETYIVCGNSRQYSIRGEWTPENLLDGLKKLQEKEK